MKNLKKLITKITRLSRLCLAPYEACVQKKTFLIILTLILININITVIFADDVDNEKIDVNEIIQVSSAPADEIKLSSKDVVVMERSTGTILYDKNGEEKVPMASTTKILTSIIVLEKANLKTMVTVSKKAAGTGGSRLGLRTGDKVKINDLLYGLMLVSGNDAAVALAEAVGGSVERICGFDESKSSKFGLEKFTFFYATWLG